jgi:hypothetical protein
MFCVKIKKNGGKMNSYGTHEVWVTCEDASIAEEDVGGIFLAPNISLPKDMGQFAAASSAKVKGLRFGVGTASTGERLMGIYPNGTSLETALRQGTGFVWGCTNEQIAETAEMLAKAKELQDSDPDE